MKRIHYLLWNARSRTADALRAIAGKIHEDTDIRVLGWEAHIVPGEGMVFTQDGGGLPLLYSEKYQGGHESIHNPIRPGYTGRRWTETTRTTNTGQRNLIAIREELALLRAMDVVRKRLDATQNQKLQGIGSGAHQAGYRQALTDALSDLGLSSNEAVPIHLEDQQGGYLIGTGPTHLHIPSQQNPKTCVICGKRS